MAKPSEPHRVKRVVAVGDFHCGHRAGLTPPDWWYSKSAKGIKGHFAKLQRLHWGEWVKLCDFLGEVDLCILNGDLIDGRGERSGGSELVEIEPLLQVEMAVEAAKALKAKKYILTYGTPYHTSAASMDMENEAAKLLNAEIFDEAFVEVNGVIISAKHKVNGSSIPHGEFTPVSRHRLHNLLWHEVGLQPKADIIVRSHTHHFCFCGTSQYMAVCLPGLQGLGTKFGAREVERVVDWGAVWFDINGGGRQEIRPDWRLIRLTAEMPKVVSV